MPGSLSNGGLNCTEGCSAIIWTAPSNAVEKVTVTAKLNDLEFTRESKVVEPTGVTHADMRSTIFAYWRGYAGAGMLIKPYLEPRKVSFYRVQIMEVGESASNVTGYFTQFSPSFLGHFSPNGANHWIHIQYDNSWDPQYDIAKSNRYSPPWQGGGGYVWNIPWKWKIGNGPVHEMGLGWTQIFSMDAQGTFTVEECDRRVVRSTGVRYGTGY